MMWDWGWHMGGFGMIIWVVILVAIIWLIVRLAGRPPGNGGSGGATSHGETALEILQKRFARGEITREEYQQMKRDLESR